MLRLARLAPAARHGIQGARYSTEGPIHGKKEKARVLRDAVAGAGPRTKSLSLSQLDNVLEGKVRRTPWKQRDSGGDSPRPRRDDEGSRSFRRNDEGGSRSSRRDEQGSRGFRRNDDRDSRDRGSFARGAAAGGASVFNSRGKGPSHRLGEGWNDRTAGRTEATSTNPFTQSIKVKKFLDRHPERLTRPQVDELVAMVTGVSVEMSTAPVWNLVLSRIGRDGYYKAMWKAFNTMKKRGTTPSSRTFTVMLNAYAGVAHSGIVNETFAPAHKPENLTLERVRRIYDLSQSHIRAVMSRKGGSRDDLGVAYPEMDEEDGGAEADKEGEINIFATNAYLKFLGRYGMWQEMEAVYLGMDKEGALAPDQVTYYIMLSTANSIDHYRRSSGADKVELPAIDIGSVGRGYWDAAVRRLCTKATVRGIDNGLALAAIQCFAAGSPADQRVAEDLIPRLWNLPAPGQPASASGSKGTYRLLPKTWTDVLPTLNLDVRGATSLLSTLRRMGNKSLVAHYSRLFMDAPLLRRNADLAFLRVLAHNLGFASDAEGAQNVIDMFQPPSGTDGWPADVYLGILNAARWNADWDVALPTFRRMVALPANVENGTVKPGEGVYKWTSPNGRKEDCRGKKWVEPRPHRVSPAAMSGLFKTALAALKGTGIKPLRQAMAIYEYYGPAHFFSVRTSAGDVDMNAGEAKHWDLARRDWMMMGEAVELARDLELATDRLLESPKEKGDVERHEKMKRDAQRIGRIWGKAIDERQGEKGAKPKPRFLRSL